jgi:hypothetical protein
MSDALPNRLPRKPRRILESLPPVDDVRDEVCRTSRRFKLLMELLGLCEKAEAERRLAPSSSATD